MGGEGSIAAMIASIKNNNRRKNKKKPFSKYKKEYTRSKPISNKKMTPQEKEDLLEKLKQNREIENKQQIQKLFISLGITLIVIVVIIFLLKLIFF
ncbi:MAG: hypothetical protein P8Q14_05310 [Vicingaceae bacterium]|nr:hypothetical protein [Vicingaceae bacterium]